MSRIGKKPVAILDGVKVALNGRKLLVEGPKGKLEWEHHADVEVKVEGDAKQIVVSRKSEERQARALHGLTRAVVANMIEGVKQGYEKKLEIIGVGYVGSLKGDMISLRVGLANELHRKIPAGLKVTMPDTTHIVIQGCDKQQVGQFAAELRALRKPEPYKGKGIRYQGEPIKLKPGKAATK
jgi:large subunit ribosomal protein L6